MAPGAGRGRCAVGQAWEFAAKRARERSAAAAVPEFLLCDDDLWRTRHPAWRSDSERAALFLPRLRSIPRVHTTAGGVAENRRGGARRGRERGVEGSFRQKVFE